MKILRLIGLLLLLSGAAFLVYTSSHNPGNFSFNGFGWQVEMPATLFVLFLAVAFIFIYLLGQTIQWVTAIPTRIQGKKSLKKTNKGLALIHQGFEALAVGNQKQALAYAKKAEKLLPQANIARILHAQSHGKEDDLLALSANPKTATSGHIGLLETAKNNQQWDKVRYHAKKILAAHAKAPVAQKALLEALLFEKNWEDALALVTSFNHKKSPEYASLAACLRLQQAMALSETAPEEATLTAQKATKRHPNFVPLIMFQVACLVNLGKHAPAEKRLASFFNQHPRLDVFSRWLDILTTTTPQAAKRMKHVKTLLKPLTEKAPALAHACLGEAYLMANKLEDSRRELLLALNFGETRALCQLLARQERKEGNTNAASDWLQKALVAPVLPQEGDDSLSAWQAFRATYVHPNMANTPSLQSHKAEKPLFQITQ